LQTIANHPAPDILPEGGIFFAAARVSFTRLKKASAMSFCPANYGQIPSTIQYAA